MEAESFTFWIELPEGVSSHRGRRFYVYMLLLQYPPWHVVKYDRSGNIMETSGLMFALLDEIGGRLNFTYQVVTPPPGDRYFGKLNSGQFNGVMGMIQSAANLSGTISLAAVDAIV